MREIIIPDTHGCRKSLQALIEKQVSATTEDRLLFLGDYIDRGPDSKGVLDYLLQLRAAGFRVDGVKGNHDEWLLVARENAESRSCWIEPGNAGGLETLDSYGIEAWLAKGKEAFYYDADLTGIPKEHFEFLESLPDILVLEKAVLVHACLDMTQKDPINETTPHIALWERSCGAIDPSKIGGRMLITGHTPKRLDHIKALVEAREPHIFLDNGCVFKGLSGLGNLLALDLGSMNLYVQPNID